jgi:hypothetical protein
MRELFSGIDAEVCEIRGLRESHPEFYDPESYAASQPFGEALRRAGESANRTVSKGRRTAFCSTIHHPRYRHLIGEINERRRNRLSRLAAGLFSLILAGGSSGVEFIDL